MKIVTTYQSGLKPFTKAASDHEENVNLTIKSYGGYRVHVSDTQVIKDSDGTCFLMTCVYAENEKMSPNR